MKLEDILDCSKQKKRERRIRIAKANKFARQEREEAQYTTKEADNE